MMVFSEIYSKVEHMAPDVSSIEDQLDNVLGCIKTDFNMRFEDWHNFNKKSEIIKANVSNLKKQLHIALDFLNFEMEKERDA